MKLCVYGASSNAIDERFIKDGEKLGQRIAERGHTVVYGGGASGMMGAVARGAHSKNGEIIGVAPSFFKVDGVLFDHCSEFIHPDTMRERKQIMEDLSDAFIVTPGGIGTFDEFFEIFTLRQLSKHTKPIAVFNINRYFDPMFNMIEAAIKYNFLTEANKKLLFSSENEDEILDYIENYVPTQTTLSELKKLRFDLEE